MQEDKKSQISINIVQVLLFCDFGSSLFKWEVNLSEHTIEDVDQHPD